MKAVAFAHWYFCSMHKESVQNLYNMNIYIFLFFPFVECSGVHRSLGVHYSKVRSLTLDAWEPEILKVMAELGNSIVNKVYEANIDPEFARATPKCHG
jgi:hypothetical protein